MRKIITYGTFDLLHVGHVQLLRRARALGTQLVVGLSTDEFNKNSMKMKQLMLIALLWSGLALPPSLMAGTVTEEWVARYNSPGSGSKDTARAMTADTSGNIYVTGRSVGTVVSDDDYVTVKYDASGNELWVANYNGPNTPPFDRDIANSVAVDTSGNVYVTGASLATPGSSTDWDYATVKYDSSGNELWVARYNGPGNAADLATAIVLDDSGNAYVTGESVGSGASRSDFTTIKYDSSGNQLWVARYNGPPGDGSDQASFIALDPSGNVYVAGASFSNDTYDDFATVKYDSDGNELWVARYAGTGGFEDIPAAMAVDTAGNVHVTGGSFFEEPDGTERSKNATVKYDPDGNQLWVASLNGPGDSGVSFVAMAVDISGNIHLTGVILDRVTEQEDYITIKLDADGNEFWQATYNGSRDSIDFATAIALDTSGNVYVTGGSQSDGALSDFDYATVKYDADGNQVWVERTGPGSAEAIVLGSSGNVYVTGATFGGTGFDIMTVKYAQAPSERLPTISADGRFVAFASSASDLVATDTNKRGDVFVRDLQTGTTTLVSVNSTGVDSGNRNSYKPVISADGRFVAFKSNASDLVASDTNERGDVFVRDLQTATTTLVSVNSAGTDSGNQASYMPKPAISADGRFVAFASSASDLVATDTNGARDVFVRDLEAETTTLISVNSAATDSGNGLSFRPAISADGRWVAFRSRASDLVATDTNARFDVFVHDLEAGTTTLVSVNSAGTDSGNGRSLRPLINADGRFVVFASSASDLVAGDTNARRDVFVRDLDAGTTTLVSANSTGTDSGDSRSDKPSISADGRFVAFRSVATDLAATADSNALSDVFVHDLQTGITRLVSANSAGADSGNKKSLRPSMSADGRFVAFRSAASDLEAADTDGRFDVFVYDVQTGTTTLASANSTGTGSGNKKSFRPDAISADGRFVAFRSAASDLVATDTNGVPDVFLRDVQTGATTLISVNNSGTDSGNGGS